MSARGWVVAGCFVTILFLYWNYVVCAFAAAFGGGPVHH